MIKFLTNKLEKQANCWHNAGYKVYLSLNCNSKEIIFKKFSRYVSIMLDAPTVALCLALCSISYLSYIQKPSIVGRLYMFPKGKLWALTFNCGQLSELILRFFGVIRVEPMNELSLLIFTGSNVSDYWTEMTCNAGTLTDWPGRWSLEDYTSNTSTNYYNIHASLTCMRSSCFFIGQFSFLAFFRINLADIRVYSPLPLPKISAKESFLLQKNNSVTIRFHKIILFCCFIYTRGKSLRFSSFFFAVFETSPSGYWVSLL